MPLDCVISGIKDENGKKRRKMKERKVRVENKRSEWKSNSKAVVKRGWAIQPQPTEGYGE